MATENLKVKITADASQAKAEIGKFKESLKDTVGAADSATGAANRLKGALTALAAVKVAKAMIQNAISVAAAGDAIKDNAQKVFMSTTAYQEWGYVLRQNGIEMASLKTGMRQFAQQVANGSDALARYGITARDIDTAFQQAIYTIQNMSSETEKVAAATELFGSRALELMPILNLTNAETQNLMNTYRAIGGTMSNELIAASDVCTDSITEMRAAWGGLMNLLAAYVIPVITKVVKWITIAIAYVRILLAAILGIKETFGGKSGSSKRSISGASANVAKNTGGTAKNLKKASKHAKELKKSLMGIDELTKLAEKATSAAAGGGGGVGGVGGGGIGDIGAGLGDIGDFGEIEGLFSEDTLKKIDAFREKVAKIAEPLNGIYLILKGLVEISLGNPIKGFQDLKDGIEKLFPIINTLKEKWNELKDKVASKVVEFKAQFSETVQTKWNALLTWWNGLKVNAKNFVADLSESVKTKWNALKTWWDGLKTNAKNFSADFSESVKTKWNALKKWWDGLKTSSKSFGADFKNNVKDAWDKFKKWWDKLKGGEKKFGVKFTFTDKLKSGWNSLAKSINAARKKSKVVSKLIPSIPTLARGGVLTNPTTALLGEYAGARSNPEIATPQSLMYETIQRANGDMVSAFAAMTRQVIEAIEGKDLSVKIGDEQIARSAQRGNTAYYNRTGKALLTT